VRELEPRDDDLDVGALLAIAVARRHHWVRFGVVDRSGAARCVVGDELERVNASGATIAGPVAERGLGIFVDDGHLGAQCGDAGGSGPCDECTADIESSTVTACATPSCESRSVRPKVGRARALIPHTTSDLLTVVETCKVGDARRSGSLVSSVCAALTKFPPSATKMRARPLRNASIDSTVSSP